MTNKKIAVIGSPGSGKSYFSRKLSYIMDVPVYHMDNLYWRADKSHITREQLVGKITEIIDTESWIIDGNYISTMEQRVSAADTIFYLDFPTEECIEGIRNRVGQKREDMSWVEQTLDEEFLKFVAEFKKETAPKVEELLKKYRNKGKRVVRFSSREEIERYLQLKDKNSCYSDKTVEISHINILVSDGGYFARKYKTGFYELTAISHEGKNDAKWLEKGYTFDHYDQYMADYHYKKGGIIMNSTIQTIKARYSCRKYTGASIEPQKIKAIALAAVQSPSAMNQQPWQIIVIQDKALIEDMDATTMDMLSKMDDKSIYERIMGRGGKLFYNAPCMFIVAKKPDTDLDCGIVTENIALAASSLGLGNVICGLAKLVFNTEKGEEYKKKLIPEGYEFGMSVLVGYPVNADGTPHEPDMSKIKYIG